MYSADPSRILAEFHTSSLFIHFYGIKDSIYVLFFCCCYFNQLFERERLAEYVGSLVLLHYYIMSVPYEHNLKPYFQYCVDMVRLDRMSAHPWFINIDTFRRNFITQQWKKINTFMIDY